MNPDVMEKDISFVMCDQNVSSLLSMVTPSVLTVYDSDAACEVDARQRRDKREQNSLLIVWAYGQFFGTESRLPRRRVIQKF